MHNEAGLSWVLAGCQDLLPAVKHGGKCEDDLPTKPPYTRIPIAEASVLVVGTARNCARALRSTVGALERATAGFGQSSFFIVESDSVDSTTRELARLEREGRIAWQSLGKLSERYPLRTDRIARCRQHIVEYVRDAPSRCDYVIIADLDGVNATIKRSALESGWANPEPWDVLTANQNGKYYDVWALRHPRWCPDDCWETARQLTPLFGNRKAIKLAVHGKQVRLQRDAGLIEVDSAFGGLAIYRTEAFLAGRYEGMTADGREVCEHVSFHAALRSQGFRIFINPAMTNAPQAEHSSSHFVRHALTIFREFRFKFIGSIRKYIID